METAHASFAKLIECYFETWYSFAKIFSTGPALLHGQDEIATQRVIPLQLQAEYGLLNLPAEVSLVDVQRRYRELAKLYHPDAGGHHADFLALQQAYEHVMEHLQTLS